MFIFPGSLSPPALPSPAPDASDRPARILLDQDAYIAAGHRNATTAATISLDGRAFEVSFWAADPPAVSHFCIHCPFSKESDDGSSTDFEYEPRVVGAEGPFVLFRVRFAADGIIEDEYFMYKADARSPSLVPVPPPEDDLMPRVNEFAVVPGAGHFLVVVLCDLLSASSHHDLRIYSSEDGAWRKERHPYPCPEASFIIPDKVITLGDGVLGWVDLRLGVLVYDLLRRESRDNAHFIPFPYPFPENRDRVKEINKGDPAFGVRDVAVTDDGVIKFIEMEHRWIVNTILPPVVPTPEKPVDPTHKGVLYDSDLIVSQSQKKHHGRHMVPKPKPVPRRRDGWRVVTWTRTISSNCWHQGHIIDVDDISVDDALFSSMMMSADDLGVERDDESSKFRDLSSALPTLVSMDGDHDVLYLKTLVTVKPKGRAMGFVVSVDLGEKKLKAFHLFNFASHDPVEYAYRPCSLSEHLHMTSDGAQTGVQEPSGGYITRNNQPLKIERLGRATPARQRIQPQALKIGVLHDPDSLARAAAKETLSDQNVVFPTSTICPPHPPQPNVNQPTWIGNHPHTQNVNPHHLSRSTGSYLPVPQPPQQNIINLPQPQHPNINYWSGIGNHHGMNQYHQQWNGGGYYPRPPSSIIQSQQRPTNLQGNGTYPGHLPDHANVHQPGILGARPFPGYVNLHQPGIQHTGPFPPHANVHQPGTPLHPTNFHQPDRRGDVLSVRGDSARGRQRRRDAGSSPRAPGGCDLLIAGFNYLSSTTAAAYAPHPAIGVQIWGSNHWIRRFLAAQCSHTL
ncbi:hypothetical protein PR202_gb18741 [Eleusine coracana subsp. coracana]|uniref:DUF1618 domain-containing protein n=1 Tax=Eleusine coracana subsp. coracana TaxID=191504 RepID=A0AAV5F455_ELECO|nr:hypothetical protein PR202_gb18741 [Eleusine coracana subsp. coracana]